MQNLKVAKFRKLLFYSKVAFLVYIEIIQCYKRRKKKSIQTNSSPYDTVLHRPLKGPIKILQNTHRELCVTEEFP